MSDKSKEKLNTPEFMQYLGGVSISTIYRQQRQKGLPRGKREFGKQEVYQSVEEINKQLMEQGQ